jgi:hypothetical protein
MTQPHLFTDWHGSVKILENQRLSQRFVEAEAVIALPQLAGPTVDVS